MSMFQFLQIYRGILPLLHSPWMKYSFRSNNPLRIISGGLLAPMTIAVTKRFKYQRNSGNKETKSRRFPISNNDDKIPEDEDEDEEYDLEEDSEYDALVNTTMNVSKNILNIQNVLIIQPYVKWGPNKLINITPESQLCEAEALVRSIPTWTISHSMKVPLENLNKKNVFGKGKLEEIKQIIRQHNGFGKPISCVFVSKSKLSFMQKQHLQYQFGVVIMDRYSIVVQILHLHATSMEAKLQVAMAEIPYIWSQMRNTEINDTSGTVYLNDNQKIMLRRRERKLKNKLIDLRTHRKLLRNKRMQQNFPIVAIVGYTNCGKTALIKALTNESGIQPRDQLFATLDVTAHAGLLPCRLKVIFMDTVGFMLDLPTGLIECFVATLEDAMLADIIVHVQDVSHENHIEQCRHVEQTLQKLWAENLSHLDRPVDFLQQNIINVGNKCDLIDTMNVDARKSNLKLISAKTHAGIQDLLLDIEQKILQHTKRRNLIVKVPMGGKESVWLYKNATVTDSAADPDNNENLMLSIVICDAKLEQFKHYFLK